MAQVFKIFNFSKFFFFKILGKLLDLKFLLNSSIANWINMPWLKLNFSIATKCIPITFNVSNDKMGLPDEPFSILQKWSIICLSFISFIIPYETLRCLFV